ncbi:hypothetical protein GGR53DRAFT_213641 [Hypoxylon sp. FL1150]|nr:hypothetical protein GGR53DRAFT_213641 [Hypoxylon sp. FL1150]
MGNPSKTPESYIRPTVSSPSSYERQNSTTAHQANRNNTRDNTRDNTRNNTRDSTRNTIRGTVRDTPVRAEQSAKPSGYPANTERKVQVESTYQNPGPGFDQTVSNLPGVGLVYNNGSSQPRNSSHSLNSAGQPFNGYNPTSGQQSQQHQTPGFAHPQASQVLPPGFSQVPQIPQISQIPAQPVGLAQSMSYNNTTMPNQGQHFQPPVPDTTYGPIPHTYHPRFDAGTGGNGGNQYVTIGGGLYQVMQAQGVTGAGAQVYYVPIQQGTGNASQPVLMQVQGGQQQGQQPVFVQGTNGSSATPVLVQVPGGQQQPFYVQVQGQSGVQPVQMGAQPGAFPAMVSQPQPMGGGGFPDVMGIGRTGTEIQIEQYHTAMNNGALEAQDMAPADPDPARMYYCRELDGEWTLRNRYGIDNLGDCRWYVMPGGIFYAVRLAD